MKKQRLGKSRGDDDDVLTILRTLSTTARHYVRMSESMLGGVCQGACPLIDKKLMRVGRVRLFSRLILSIG